MLSFFQRDVLDEILDLRVFLPTLLNLFSLRVERILDRVQGSKHKVTNVVSLTKLWKQSKDDPFYDISSVLTSRKWL